MDTETRCLFRALFRKQLREQGAFLVRSASTGRHRTRAGRLAFGALYGGIVLLVMGSFFSLAWPLGELLLPAGQEALYFLTMELLALAVGVFAGAGRTVQYREGLYVGYRYYQTAGVPVAFPFGYGLSYTSFAYSDLKVTADSVSLTVTNTGARDGAEIVQVYIAKPGAEIFRPAQELKAFARVPLAAGESRTVTLPLDDKAFRYWNTRTDCWEVEGGRYEVRVGASSADIRLTADVDICGTNAPDPYAGKALPHYKSGSVQNVPDAEWEALLGHPIPQDKVKIDRNMTLGELNHSRSPLGWLIWAVLTALLNASFKKGKPDLNVLFQYNMPLRALAKMTSGAISMGMVDGIVLEAKGFWVIGLLKVIVGAVKNIILNAQLESRLRNS